MIGVVASIGSRASSATVVDAWGRVGKSRLAETSSAPGATCEYKNGELESLLVRPPRVWPRKAYIARHPKQYVGWEPILQERTPSGDWEDKGRPDSLGKFRKEFFRGDYHSEILGPPGYTFRPGEAGTYRALVKVQWFEDGIKKGERSYVVDHYGGSTTPGSCTTPLATTSPSPGGPSESWGPYKTLIGDVNGDGFDDLIWNATAETNRTFVGLGNSNGQFSFLPPQDHPNHGWSLFKTLVGDVNGDGFDDVIWNATTDKNRTYVGLGSSNGTLTFLPYQDHPNHGWTSFKTLVGDVNGDGFDDVIWNATTDKNRTYVGLGSSNGTLTFLPYQDHPNHGWTSFKTLVGDVNGDGFDDVIWNATTDKNRTYVGLGSSSGILRFLSYQDHPNGGWSTYKTLIGNVNGDAFADVVWNATGEVNRTYVGLGGAAGTLRFLHYQDHSSRGWSTFDTLLGDVNGDHRDDLVWNSTEDVNRTYVGLGSSGGVLSFLAPQDHPSRNWSTYEALIGDVNGDGYKDVIWNSTSETNRIYVGLGSSSGSFTFLPYQDHTS